MRWRKRKDDTQEETSSNYEDKARERLRGIGEIEHASSDEDAATIEARLRNMIYGTNRE